ncbi:hypothetical protein, partial [Neisseria meningitidis]|uniref:hypothetical protein n=1 Tax=Neisseria meningitidis TaxID=487 RepID=UPI001C8F7691
VYEYPVGFIVALRNEKGSYNQKAENNNRHRIVALRNEKGSYNLISGWEWIQKIVALRNENGRYNQPLR